MHELSIAMGIVDIAENEARKAKASRVDVIELEIGSIAGIEMSSFNFVWPMAVKGTVLENAKREIRRIEARAVCLECNKTFQLSDLYEGCPDCNSYFKDIIQGRELRVRALEVS